MRRVSWRHRGGAPMTDKLSDAAFAMIFMAIPVSLVILVVKIAFFHSAQ